MDNFYLDEGVAELSTFFLGSAKIYFKNLSFPFPLFGAKVFNIDNVAKLKEKLQVNQLARMEPRYYISATISEDLLRQTIIQSDISEENLKSTTDPPFLSLPDGYKILCLYGKHRVEVAKELLYSGDHWWAVNLFRDDLPENLVRHLRALNDDHMDAGDALRNLRHSKLSNYSGDEIEYWESKISRRGREDLKRLEDRYPRISRALDQLIVFPGLWPDISITFIRRLVECSCPSEISNYLNLIYNIWSTLFSWNSTHVDVNSVRLVENLMPESNADQRHIVTLMDQSVLFPSVVDGSDRAKLLSGLLDIKGRILSLRSLIQDTLLLEPCAKALQRLVPSKSKDVRDALMRRFDGTTPTWAVQVSESATEFIGNNSAVSSLLSQRIIATLAYVQLWLFAIRHIESLTDTHLAGPRNQRCNEDFIYRETEPEFNSQLATLAQTLGFRSSQIDSLCRKVTAKPSARAYLLGRRPPERYAYPQDWAERGASKIVDVLKWPRPKSAQQPVMPALAWEGEGGFSIVQKRCGLPQRKTHAKDKQFVFIPQIYRPAHLSGEHPTTFAVLQDIIFCFFGRYPFPAGFKASWWDTSTDTLCATPTEGSHNITHSPALSAHFQPEVGKNSGQTEDMSSPVSMEPHPPGTPDYNDKEPMQSEVEGPPATPSEIVSWELISRPPIAVGFEDDSHIAPLGQRTFMAHHRGAKEILDTWYQSGDPSLVIFYFFKERRYCKFQLNHPSLEEHLRDLIDPISNDHYFADPTEGLVNSDDIIDRICHMRVVLAYTEPAHRHAPGADLMQYVYSFDNHTGKRRERDERHDKQDGSSARSKRQTMGQPSESIDSIDEEL
ncbi:hypothetical protein BDV37DRAFT_289914 [Aspergillus pseudonomiae]|uniref:Uncharacterized protein n=1 Tax=Aspergillus pseudonomiae TaxID=1506151 RepID=A0A5N7CRJ1_9EURO|nr:uncharacterized protein BDV37DRAFT_289914 [Aspergillus pseudonomiae]KAE8396862.1 hypothetical protein BDV37DRAFT_289914 [Aspergillus pseudonomiae]